MRQVFLILLSCFTCLPNAVSQTQELLNPFNFPILLSGSFGELRSNHFHSGIDFKTQGVEGKAVHAVQDGYVSRIGMSPYGYGNVLYLDHPDGTTTVYGHLLKFNDSIETYTRNQQYELEQFTVNLYPEKGLLPVKRGDVIALGGNTGGSAGPHLHFEVRDTELEEALDPLVYYLNQIKDTRPPRIQGIMVYPFEGRGSVNNSHKKTEFIPTADKNGHYTLPGKIEAWGDIGLAVKAYDYMDNTANIYGVKKIVLLLEQDTVFYSYLDRFAFSETRYLDSFTDYEEWRNKRSFYMKSFVDPGNKLRFIKSRNRGIITINEEKEYTLLYQLEDAFGNTAQLKIPIQGKEQEISAPDTEDSYLFHWRSENKFGSKGIRLTIPKNNLYEDIYFRYRVKEDTTALAATHTLHDRVVALHSWVQLSIHLQSDTLENKKQYGIVRLQNGKPTWIGGEYRNGWIDADIRDLGTFTIYQDKKPPVITPLGREKWVTNKSIAFRIVDNLSGLKSYRGEIDGRYVLFEFDGKKGLVYYNFDSQRLSRGQHTLRLTATDACGNTAEYTDTFTW